MQPIKMLGMLLGRLGFFLSGFGGGGRIVLGLFPMNSHSVPIKLP